MSNADVALLAGAIGAAGAVLGALVSGVVAYITQRRKAKDERDIWLRQERFAACSDFIAISFQYAGLDEEDRPSFGDLLAATSRVQVSTRPGLASQAEELMLSALWSEEYEPGQRDPFPDEWRAFIDLVRDDLGVPGDPSEVAPVHKQFAETLLERLGP